MKFLPILPILTRYPFLKVAARFFESEFKSLESAFNSKIFDDALEIAKNIILSSIDGKQFEREFEVGDLLCTTCEKNCEDFENCEIDFPKKAYEELKAKAKLSILSYISSKILVSFLEDWIRIRYAVNEANYYSKLLKKESDTVLRLIAKDLGIKFQNNRIHIVSYVRASSKIKSEKWRLVNRRFSNGYVYATRGEFIRIVEEFLRERLAEKVNVSGLECYFNDVLKELKIKERKFKKSVKVGKVDANVFPPCIKEILAELQSGMNVPHIARFSLASFLLNIGMSVDDVVEVFRSAPDFDEEKTRYQVEHIAGQRGRCVEYICPSCDTMQSYQLCVAECGVKHPIDYYRKMLKTKRKTKRE